MRYPISRMLTERTPEIPPIGLLPFRSKRATPYIYSDDEIQQILKAARNLPPSTGLRPCTYYTLLGLMTVTGMRISEIINLDRDDVDLKEELLAVRLTKFSKSRLIPLHPSTVEKLVSLCVSLGMSMKLCVSTIEGEQRMISCASPYARRNSKGATLLLS